MVIPVVLVVFYSARTERCDEPCYFRGDDLIADDYRFTLTFDN